MAATQNDLDWLNLMICQLEALKVRDCPMTLANTASVAWKENVFHSKLDAALHATSELRDFMAMANSRTTMPVGHEVKEVVLRADPLTLRLCEQRVLDIGFVTRLLERGWIEWVILVSVIVGLSASTALWLFLPGSVTVLTKGGVQLQLHPFPLQMFDVVLWSCLYVLAFHCLSLQHMLKVIKYPEACIQALCLFVAQAVWWVYPRWILFDQLPWTDHIRTIFAIFHYLCSAMVVATSDSWLFSKNTKRSLLMILICWFTLSVVMDTCLHGSLPNRFGEESSCKPNLSSSLLSIRRIFIQGVLQYVVFAGKDLATRIRTNQLITTLRPEWAPVQKVDQAELLQATSKTSSNLSSPSKYAGQMSDISSPSKYAGQMSDISSPSKHAGQICDIHVASVVPV